MGDPREGLEAAREGVLAVKLMRGGCDEGPDEKAMCALLTRLYGPQKMKELVYYVGVIATVANPDVEGIHRYHEEARQFLDYMGEFTDRLVEYTRVEAS